MGIVGDFDVTAAALNTPQPSLQVSAGAVRDHQPRPDTSAEHAGAAPVPMVMIDQLEVDGSDAHVGGHD